MADIFDSDTSKIVVEPEPNNSISVLQLLSALTIKPSQWHRLINSIDSSLDASFSMLELKPEHLADPRTRSLFKDGYLIIPTLSSLAVFLCLYLCHQSVENCLYGIAFGATASFLISIFGSFTTSVATGILIGLIGGASSGIAHGFGNSEGAFITAELDVFAHQIFGEAPLDIDIGTGYWAVLLSSSIAAAAIINIAKSHRSAGVSQKISSILLGTTIGVLTLFLIILLIAFIGPYSISLVIGLLSMITIGLQTQKWLVSFGIGISIGLINFLGNAVFFIKFYENVEFTNSYTSIIAKSVAHASLEAIFFTIIFAAPYVISKKLADEISGAIAGVLGSAGGYMGLAIVSESYSLWPDAFIGITIILIGITIIWWVPILLYPVSLIWDSILYFTDRNIPSLSQRNLITLNSSFWTELQYLPLLGLDNHLLLLLERDHKKGKPILDFLSSSHQRWAVRRAQIEFDARDLEKRQDIEDIRKAHERLSFSKIDSSTGQSETILYSFSRVSEDIDAALKQKSSYNKRLSLNYSIDRLGALLRELNRTHDQYAVRFMPIVTSWLSTVNSYIDDLTESLNANQEIVSPYIVGIPINQQQSIFVGRVDIAKRIEHLIIHYAQSPPVLLYGQRRMGKTSLINNFGKLLTSAIVPMFVDLQGPASSAKHDVGFLYGIAKSMAISAKRTRNVSLQYPSYSDFEKDPFITFNDWLDSLEEVLQESVILIALDEFEVLEGSFSRGQLREADILGMLRNIIQHRPRFRLLLSGSNTLDKFQKWSNYLINTKVFKVGYLNDEESHQLIVSPVEEFQLLYETEALQRVIWLTRGHPYLIQLLCDEIIFLKNEQDYSNRHLVSVSNVEAASKSALDVGQLFFRFIESQVDELELCFLHSLASVDGSNPNTLNALPLASLGYQISNLDDVARPLCQLDIIEPYGKFYRFQVELIRRWFSQKT